MYSNKRFWSLGGTEKRGRASVWVLSRQKITITKSRPLLLCLPYGKHIFQNNFSLVSMLEILCSLNLTYLQKENVVKIWAINTKSLSRYETCWLANVTFLMDTNSHFCPSNITFAWKTNKNNLENFWKLASNEQLSWYTYYIYHTMKFFLKKLAKIHHLTC